MVRSSDQEIFMAAIDILLHGFFGKSHRGFLGWSGCYLVTTPSGRRVLFDTAGYNERGTLPGFLKERGVAVGDIDAVILSHLHFDHAANWDLFPNAEVIVHQDEVAYAQSPQADHAILRYPVPALLAHQRLRLISGERVTLEDGVQIVHVPGHTPGAIALTLERSILCGDALKSRWDLRGHLMNSWNDELSRQSIEKITSLADRIYPGHDMPLERRGNQWCPCGSPSVRVLFPDGTEHVITAPDQ
jgi:glyoxylase-like metal-dependent hydrolase (beta-lactamase superfamily II)